MDRFAAFLMITGVASPTLATTPSEPPRPVPGLRTDFSLAPGVTLRASEPSSIPKEQPAYPTEQPPVPANDAMRPELLWNPTPASLVKVVPAKVRYKLNF